MRPHWVCDEAKWPNGHLCLRNEPHVYELAKTRCGSAEEVVAGYLPRGNGTENSFTFILHGSISHSTSLFPIKANVIK